MARELAIKKRRSRQPLATDQGALVLQARLSDVLEALEPAARRREKKGEAVHRLRVAARRGVAAIDLLQPLLPRRKAKRLRQKLQRIRRACDTARNGDVLLARLRRRRAGQGNAALIRGLEKERLVAQKLIEAVHRDLGQSERLARSAKKLQSQVRWGRRDTAGPEPTYAKFLRQQLQSPVKCFLRALPKRKLQNRLDPPDLHQLRIRGKRLRYALELAASSQRMKRIDKVLRELQDLLGEINDGTMALKDLRQRLAAAKKSAAAAHLKLVVTSEEKSLATALRAFGSWQAKPLLRLLKLL